MLGRGCTQRRAQPPAHGAYGEEQHRRDRATQAATVQPRGLQHRDDRMPKEVKAWGFSVGGVRGLVVVVVALVVVRSW